VGKQMTRQDSGNQINIDSLSTYGVLALITPYNPTCPAWRAGHGGQVTLRN